MKAASTRQKKVSSLLKTELGQIFQQEMQHSLSGTMVTVTDVEVSPDLAIAKVYLNFMLAKNHEELLQLVKAYKSEVRKHLGRRIGKQVRITPDLQFFYDDTFERAQRIESILSKLDIPPDDEEKEE